MARAVAASSTAVDTPETTWQTSSRSTAPRSMRHAMAVIRRSTEGSWEHRAPKPTWPSGFTE